jgi:hypothetical protein
MYGRDPYSPYTECQAASFVVRDPRLNMHKVVFYWLALAQMTQVLCLAGPTSGSVSDTVEVSGIVFNPKQIGIPGAIISTVSPDARQKSAYSDNQGRFTFRVPVGDVSKWYVEIYWNKDLMFRNEMRQLKIKGEGSNFGPLWAEAFKTGGRVDLEPIVLGQTSNPVQ